LTGPEFAERLRADVKAANIEVWLNAMVIEAYPDKTLIVSRPEGISAVKPDAVIFAVGARNVLVELLPYQVHVLRAFTQRVLRST